MHQALELRASRVASEKGAYRKRSGQLFVSGMTCHPPGMRVALLASILPLVGCALPTEIVQPAMDYPPGPFDDCGGPPKVRPCMAGALLCSPPGG